MNLDLDRLKALAQPREKIAREKAGERRKNRGWLKKSQDVALAIHYYLRTNGMSQKQFAEKMDVSAPYVAKLLRGTENLTLETIDKIEEALETEIVSISRPYETILESPFQPISKTSMAAKSLTYSGKTACDNYASIFSLNYAV